MTGTTDDIIRSLPALYDAALGADRWTPALDMVARLAPSKGVMLYAIGHDESPYSVSKSNSFYADKGELIAEYTEKFLQYDLEGMAVVAATEPFRPVPDTDIWPDLDMLRNREDIKFVRRLGGIFRRITFNLSDTPHLTAGVILQFDKRFHEPPNRAIENGKTLTPHLAKALEINRFFAPLRQRYDAVLAVLDRVSVGIAVATPGGELVVVNETARRIFDGAGPLSLDRAGRIRGAQSDTGARIAAAIADCAGTAQGAGTARGHEITVPRTGSDPLLVLISPLRDAEAELERGYAGALVTIVDPDVEVPLRIDGLARVYGLTGAETETAALLLQGLTAEAIADTRGVTPGTVRSQIKAIYAKSGAPGRHAFMWKAIQFLPPVL